MRLSWLILGVIILCAFALPAGAVVQEVTVKGPVATAIQSANTITIANPVQYGCSYPSTGAPVCTWTPVNVSVLTGTVPDVSAYSVFKPGDTVVATSIGGAGETWITLAKLYGSRPNEEFVTDIVGDVQNVPDPLIGNYSLDVTTVPDCSQCSGTKCKATSADVRVMSTGTMVLEKILTPGQSFTYNGRNDGSSVALTFIGGEALSDSCPNIPKGMIGGIQPVSVYLVHVIPPIGYGQVNLRTASTTRPDEALTPLPATSTIAAPVATAIVATPTATQQSGGLPFAIIGALGVLALVVRKK